MRCLEGAEIERYTAGIMDPRGADEATRHLTECKRCRTAVAEARARLAEGPLDSERVDKAMVKAVCPGCNARYGIPEDRVKGRVLKIRCKACGGIIEVRGVSSAPPAGAKSVLDRGRKVWFLVIRRERIGPITEQEVRERFARNEIKPRTYAWRQGFARWERLYNISELKDLAVEVPRPPAEIASEGVQGRRPITRPLPEIWDGRDSPTPAHETAGDNDLDRTERAKRSAGLGVRTLKQSTEELDFDSRRPVDTYAKTPVMDAAVEANLSAIRTHYHAPPEITPELRPGFRTQEDAPLSETAPREVESGASQLTHVHYKERDPLADLPESLDQAAEVEESAASRTSVIPQRVMEEPEPRRPPSSEVDRHLRAQRNEDSVLFSLGHLRKVAHTALPPRPVSTGMTGLFNIKAAARPAPLLIPVEEPPRAPRGVAFTVGVLTLGALLGAGALFGGLYLARPNLVRSLLGLGPAPSGERTVARPLEASAAATGALVRTDALRLAAATPAADAGTPPTGSGIADSGVARSSAAADAGAVERKAPAVAAKAIPKAEAKAPAVEAKALPKTKKKRRKRTGIAVVDPAGAESPDGDEKPELPEKPAPEKKDTPEPKKESKPKKGSTTEELDRLIDAAAEGKPPPPKGKAEPKEEKKTEGGEPKAAAPALSREQVAGGMRRAAGVVQECNDKFKQSGMVTLEVTIDGGSGRIGRGKVVGGFAGTALGECVLSGVKRAAQFPKFGGQITIQFPFMLK